MAAIFVKLEHNMLERNMIDAFKSNQLKIHN